MERFEIEIVSFQDKQKLHVKIRQALVCGFFLQIAHKEGGKGNYTIAKEPQVKFDYL